MPEKDVIIGGLATLGSGFTALVGYFAGIRKSRAAVDTAKISAYISLEMKLLEHRNEYEARLNGRILDLEAKLDSANQRCDEKVQGARDECKEELAELEGRWMSAITKPVKVPDV